MIKNYTEAVVADKGYDIDDIKDCIMAFTAKAIIPVKSNSRSNNDDTPLSTFEVLKKTEHLTT